MVDKLVDWILGSIVFSEREVAPVSIVDLSNLSESSNECCNIGECGLTSVDVIELPKGDEIKDVIEAASDKHVAGVGEQLHSGARVVTVEDIMMVDVGHNVGNFVESLMQKKCMTQTTLVFQKKDSGGLVNWGNTSFSMS